MSNTVDERDGKLVVTLDGSIDLEHAPELRKTLLACVGRHMDLVVDLTAVEYIDSSGIANLVEALQAARQRGVGFGLVAAAGQVMRVIRLARLDKVFSIHDDLAGALAARA